MKRKHIPIKVLGLMPVLKCLKWWGITHLAEDLECALGQQKVFCSESGHFSRMNLVVEWKNPLSMLSFWSQCSLCELIKSYIEYMLCGQFFALNAISVCRNESSLVDGKHAELLCLLAVMRMVLWMMRMKEFHGALSLSFHHLVAERWMMVAWLIHVNWVASWTFWLKYMLTQPS